MTPEVHPEEALDLAIAGKLPDADRPALEQHLAVCRACKGHLALLSATRQLCAAQPWDERSNRQAIEHALSRYAKPRWPRLPFSAGRSRWLLVTAGMILAAGGMASAAWWYRQAPVSEEGLRAQRERPAAAAPAHARLNPALAALAPASLEAVPSPPPGLESAGLESAALDSTANEGGHASSARTARVLPSASALFEQASALRARNRLDDSMAAFRKLQQLFPQSRECRLSYALVGRMLLDRGHPAQALAQFDRHLVQGGEAAEEALAGRATALGQLGRVSAERESWQRLLNSYPSSVYAGQAKNRLMQMRRSEEVFPVGDPSL
jgi:tetratricopeptide (TPR) repeat protein